MRATLKTLFVLPLVFGAAMVADARILGGGPKKTDCFMYFDGINATNGKFKVDCHDNDETCDVDPTVGTCTFRFTVCSGATDVPGCTPADVTQFKGGGISKLNLPPTGPPACASSPTDYSLKLKKNGTRPNTKTFKLSAKTASGRDPDTLVLHCVASPSGAFIFE